MRTNKFILSIAALAGLLAGLSHMPANAALITLSGTNVDFTYDDGMLGLYGIPTVSGDSLFFSPTGFKTSSLNGAGMTSLSATTYIDITAHEGYSFSSLSWLEIGDYKLLGSNSTVNISGAMFVIDTDTPPPAGPYSLTSLTTTDDLGVRDGALHLWTASSQLDLADDPWTDSTMLRVTLENLLDSYTSNVSCDQLATPSRAGRKPHREKRERHQRRATPRGAAASSCGQQQAFIEKKYSGLTVEMNSVPPTSVPVPPALPLLLSGLLPLIGIGAKRKTI